MEEQIALYNRYLAGDDKAIGGWLTAVSMEARRRTFDPGWPPGGGMGNEHLIEKSEAFVREWARVRRVYVDLG